MTTTATTGARRFEFTEGSSHKFWEISPQGAEVTVRYGRIGAQGQTNVKSFPDEAAAANPDGGKPLRREELVEQTAANAEFLARTLDRHQKRQLAVCSCILGRNCTHTEPH